MNEPQKKPIAVGVEEATAPDKAAQRERQLLAALQSGEIAMNAMLQELEAQNNQLRTRNVEKAAEIAGLKTALNSVREELKQLREINETVNAAMKGVTEELEAKRARVAELEANLPVSAEG